MVSVIIVGAGLAGLSAALSLSNIEKIEEIIILEKRPNFVSRGSAFGLARNGQKALKEIAKDENFINQFFDTGVPIDNALSESVMVLWSVVRDALLERVLQVTNTKIQLLMGVEIKDVIIDEDKSSFANNTCVVVTQKNSNELFKGDFLIGADGVHSQVRNILGLSPPERQSTVWRGAVNFLNNNNVGGVRSKINTDALMVNEAMAFNYFSKLTGSWFSIFSFHRKCPGQLAWVANTQIDDATNVKDIRDLFCDASGNDREIIKAVLDETDPATIHGPVDLCTYDLTRYVNSLSSKNRSTTFTIRSESIIGGGDCKCGWGGKGRVTIIGDAAHALRPATGQGGSMAFEDSALLARFVSQAVHGNDSMMHGDIDWEDVLRRFESVRLSRVSVVSQKEEELAKNSYENGKLFEMSQDYRDWLLSGV